MSPAHHDSNVALNLPLGVVLLLVKYYLRLPLRQCKIDSWRYFGFHNFIFPLLLCIPLLLLTALLQRGRAAFSVQDKAKLGLRSAMGLGSFGCLFAALQTIDLSK